MKKKDRIIKINNEKVIIKRQHYRKGIEAVYLNRIYIEGENKDGFKARDVALSFAMTLSRRYGLNIATKWVDKNIKYFSLDICYLLTFGEVLDPH